jgi:hypothetical protein
MFLVPLKSGDPLIYLFLSWMDRTPLMCPLPTDPPIAKRSVELLIWARNSQENDVPTHAGAWIRQLSLLWSHVAYTAKTHYRKFVTNIPRKGIERLQSQFPHSCVCERFIHIFPQPVCLFCCRKIGGPILRIFKSLTYTWMSKLGLRSRESFSGNT